MLFASLAATLMLAWTNDIDMWASSANIAQSDRAVRLYNHPPLMIHLLRAMANVTERSNPVSLRGFGVASESARHHAISVSISDAGLRRPISILAYSVGRDVGRAGVLISLPGRAGAFLFTVYNFWSGGMPWGFANSLATGPWGRQAQLLSVAAVLAAYWQRCSLPIGSATGYIGN